MKLRNLKKWCCLSVILPGIAFLASKKASARGSLALCHLPAMPPQPKPFEPEWWYQKPLYTVVAVAIIISITTGFFLLVRHLRKRNKLKDHLKKGSLSKKDFEKLK